MKGQRGKKIGRRKRENWEVIMMKVQGNSQVINKNVLGEGKDYDWEVSCDVKEVVLKWDTDDTLLMDVARCLHLAGGTLSTH